jgi:alkyldihydroxyacetonephosphate synthase
MQQRRRKFFGWGYEGETVSPDEMREFEAAWSRLLGIEHYEPAAFPTLEEIDIRAPRIVPPASLEPI